MYPKLELRQCLEVATGDSGGKLFIPYRMVTRVKVSYFMSPAGIPGYVVAVRLVDDPRKTEPWTVVAKILSQKETPTLAALDAALTQAENLAREIMEGEERF